MLSELGALQAGLKMSERITEQLVRSHFITDPIFDQVNFEEQKSTSPHIAKLFANSSKKGSSERGYPEFILSFPGERNQLIIVECKASTSEHESSNRDNPAGYAVDGALHYLNHANMIDNRFEIISIAVSGTSSDDLKISHFHSPSNSDDFVELKDQALLSIYSYLKIQKSYELARQLSDVQIQQKAQEYNNVLHGIEIPERERCTFVSAVLLALQDDFFRSGYDSHSDVQELVDLIVGACERVLKKNSISEERRDTILRHYSSIKNHKITNVKLVRNRITGRHEANEAVSNFVDTLHIEIYPLVHMEEQGFDVLGRFYREFVRYAGADQSTGLVLTPEHITDLFCDLVKLKVDDVVYDPCCGTGGFLISALKKLFALAGNDAEKISKIKESQLIGAEVRADMFTYACSNMMMRGDGKSQIFNTDCFSEDHKQLLSKNRPTVAMLNPPYSKSTGPAEQLDFIFNALEDIATLGRCAAIVQTSCALTSKKAVKAMHEKLLRKHRLDAVISVPDQLFYPIGVNTCIMVFTAHDPHPSDHGTWFGYLKDDGFTIHKKKGRIPLNWDQKRKQFLAHYLKKEKVGLAVVEEVAFDDEWLAEAYLETDYTILDQQRFDRKLRDFLGYQFLSGRISDVSSKNLDAPQLSLSDRKWKLFKYDAIFQIRKGYYNKKPPVFVSGKNTIPFIGATEYNNGVTSVHDREDIVIYSRNGEMKIGEAEERKIFLSNCITVSNNGSVGNAFFQADEFTCSHDVNPLYLKDREISPQIGIFLCTVIEVDKYRWGYGRKWRPSRMPNSTISLPVNEYGEPDWVFMENFIGQMDLNCNLDIFCSNPSPEVKSKVAH